MFAMCRSRVVTSNGVRSQGDSAEQDCFGVIGTIWIEVVRPQLDAYRCKCAQPQSSIAQPRSLGQPPQLAVRVHRDRLVGPFERGWSETWSE